MISFALGMLSGKSLTKFCKFWMKLLKMGPKTSGKTVPGHRSPDNCIDQKYIFSLIDCKWWSTEVYIPLIAMTECNLAL